MSVIQKVKDAVWITLTVTSEEPGLLDGLDDEDYEAIIYGLIGISTISTLIVGIRRRNFDADWREELIFHPVAMKKFILLSFISFGTYQSYWIFKNWLWLRNVKQENISPVWRAIFAPFMNIGLFRRIKDVEQSGYMWFEYAAVPLALLYFIGAVINRVYEKWETAPLWFGVLALATMLILVPVVLQVNKMNEGCEDLIAKNSKFDWPVVGMIVIFSPIFSLVMYSFMVGY